MTSADRLVASGAVRSRSTAPRSTPSTLPGAGGPPLVFLHEGLGCVEMWRGFPAAVHAALGRPPALVYSRAGYGHSGPAALPRPVTYMHHEADVVLPALLAATRDRAAAARRPQRRRVDRPAPRRRRPRRRRARAPRAARRRRGRHASTSIAAARDAYATTDLRDRLGRYHDDVDAHVPRLERRVAVAGVPVVGHHRPPAGDHRAGAASSRAPTTRTARRGSST